MISITGTTSIPQINSTHYVSQSQLCWPHLLWKHYDNVSSVPIQLTSSNQNSWNAHLCPPENALTVGSPNNSKHATSALALSNPSSQIPLFSPLYVISKILFEDSERVAGDSISGPPSTQYNYTHWFYWQLC